jgi:mycothiol synthase
MPLRPVRVPADGPALARLLDEIERRDGYDPLTEDAHLSAGRAPEPAGSREPAGSQEPGVVAVDDDRIVAYAHIRRESSGAVIETAIHPDCRPLLAHELLRAAVSGREESGVSLWASEPETVAAARAMGFEETRRLLQLVRPLPPEAEPDVPGGIELTRFRPDADVDAFLAVNDVAFVGHPDNEGWTAETVAGRMTRAWFDPAGFFLAWEQAQPVGVCWTKVHPAATGEIYVIAVDPTAQRRGLGRALALVGMWDLHERRECERVTLYVEADNLAALGLYRRLGFEPLRTKRLLRRPALSEA